MPLSTASDANKDLQGKMREIELKRLESRAKQQALDLGLPYVSLVGHSIPAEVLSFVPEAQAKELAVIPFRRHGETVAIATIAAINDKRKELADHLLKTRYVTVEWHFMSQNSFDHAIELYGTVPKVLDRNDGVEVNPEDIKQWQSMSGLKDIGTKLQTLSTTEMLNLIIAGALNTKSSDVHIEAEESGIKVRYRIDGVLTDIATLERDAWAQLVARIKLLSKMKINVSQHPQDGRFRIELPESLGGKVDVRVSTLPTKFGESIVIRLLGSSLAGDINFETLGLRGKAFDALKYQVGRPNGMIITTGPTGSGKTTTMYTILRMLNGPDVKIITIEDPIEYELKGINQSQVDPQQGYTFANGLRSIVRQDPDIILVGEIRDAETTEIAIQAALTGHLVLSTVHTNSASGTVPRLLALGAKPFLLAPAMNAMIGQRLVRRLCEKCKRPAQLPDELKGRARKTLEAISPASRVTVDWNALHFFEAPGCDACHQIGYSGQIGIYEIMIMSKEIEKAVHGGDISEVTMQEISVQNGMITMVQDGLLKALDGITSVQEVFRVAE
ncbi:type II/IV secretion system protein [Candidatus Uhrbacteria bacterium]|nr:type II/IV secretion system protein [Candidatus Uhrbacteria bacterium]